MFVNWTCESQDGKVSKTSNDNESSLSYSIGDKPRETSKCVFEILSVTVTSPEQDNVISSSYYLSLLRCISNNEQTNELDSGEIITTIGLSCVTDVDRLIDICLMKMIKDEVSQFCIETIKRDTIVNVKLKLQSFEDTVELFEMSSEEILEFASNLKADGVKLYSEQRVEDAFHKFSKALKYLITIDPKKEGECHQAITKLTLTLLNNLAGCHVSPNFKNWDSAIELCSQVLDKDPSNMKALFRRGVSYLENQDYENARQDFLQAKELDPKNQIVKIKLDLVYEKENASKQKYAAAMKKMFST